MNAIDRVKAPEVSGQPLSPRYQVDVSDLAVLIVAINRWDRFLDGVFFKPVKGILTDEMIEELSLEDSQHYLDVQIQLSQCLRNVNDPELVQHFETICREVKKSSYQLISTTLRNLADNKRSLVELGNKDEHVLQTIDKTTGQWLHAADLEVSLEYKDCLLQQRKQLKSEMVGQKSNLKSQVVKLKDKLRDCFNHDGQLH
ncbi:MAG: hypothetical protein KTR18_17270 [Acidiferrobacterales bacterium]|nr:hypothetical protein [Acidiferrobacterales bacterium]